jgi:deoxycytidine triphosphate deaminase
MTEAQRKTFERIATRYTEVNTVTRAVARATLVREGIRLPDGRLAPEYGGKATRASKKAVVTRS